MLRSSSATVLVSTAFILCAGRDRQLSEDGGVGRASVGASGDIIRLLARRMATKRTLINVNYSLQRIGEQAPCMCVVLAAMLGRVRHRVAQLDLRGYLEQEVGLGRRRNTTHEWRQLRCGRMGVIKRLRGRARQLKRETIALYLACRDPRTRGLPRRLPQRSSRMP